ncbi:hypothetical protein [Pseudoalteromonas rubra]|uniref:Uncharacterized protein n=1 Tax=Pseudoalteromonas rubra TaxID=43658 RepID=A0A0F4QAI0_9GAMM|nr:hypothetical protein [Pseudoalteromonas rubra]KJZ04344.1 hypothetical protein TW77_23560 [Pseudoalteromonas rubra]
MKLRTLSNKVLPSKLQAHVTGSNGSGNNPIIYPESNGKGKELSTQQITFVVGGNGSGNDPGAKTRALAVFPGDNTVVEESKP